MKRLKREKQKGRSEKKTAYRGIKGRRNSKDWLS